MTDDPGGCSRSPARAKGRDSELLLGSWGRCFGSRGACRGARCTSSMTTTTNRELLHLRRSQVGNCRTRSNARLGAVTAPPPTPGYGYGYPQPQTSSDAIVALVLAIASWVLCPFVLAIAALVFASTASRAIAGSNGWLAGEGMVTAARIIAWLNIGLTTLFLGFLIVMMIFAAVSSDVNPNPTNFDAVASLF